ncbi:MAG: 2-C-methyl-D-erythritol 4-phosphate cytidylyltransferase [bacterium]|nr:2-C-methyl-D-erythritol 4-phosphate cytidylyltransferase [bacterium]
MNVTAVIVAAGEGKRMGAGKSKMFLNLGKETTMFHTFKAFQDNELVNEIIVVISEQYKELFEEEAKKHDKVKKIILGGETRQQSSYNGVFSADSDIILVHDGARPFVSQECITNSINDAIEFGASVVAVPAKDTIKKVTDNFVDETLDRSSLWLMQTPQTFKSEIIKEAHEKAKEENFIGTDEASLVERIGKKVRITKGSYDNIKITTPDDLIVAEKILGDKNA